MHSSYIHPFLVTETFLSELFEKWEQYFHTILLTYLLTYFKIELREGLNKNINKFGGIFPLLMKNN
jgi:hypothetical protein